MEKKPVFTEISGTEVDALLYTAMFNEVNRLEDCKNKKERQRIRDFILSAYRDLRIGQSRLNITFSEVMI